MFDRNRTNEGLDGTAEAMSELDHQALTAPNVVESPIPPHQQPVPQSLHHGTDIPGVQQLHQPIPQPIHVPQQQHLPQLQGGLSPGQAAMQATVDPLGVPVPGVGVGPMPETGAPVDLQIPMPKPKKQRRRYDNNFKAEVLEHLKIPGTKLPAVAKQFGIPENTLREWTKVSVVQSIEAARAKHGGTLKANMYDPMHRLTESLMVFFDRNERQPQHLKQPVTTKLVVAKGLEARNNLLELNEIQPFLEDKERKALEAFTGSDSWAKKFAKRHDLKMTGARVKELADDDVRNYSVQLRQMASRVKQAGPGYEEVASLLRQAAEKLVAARIVATRRANQQQR